MGYCVIGIILESVLERIGCAVGIGVAELNLAEIDQSIDVARICLQNLAVELGRFVQTIFKNQQLHIVLFDLQVAGMCAVERSVLCRSLVEIATREIEVTQHSVAFGVIREIALGLPQKILD